MAGERDKEKLLSLCHKSVREKKGAQLLTALEGHYTQSGLFALGQAYQGYLFYEEQRKACDQQLQATLQQINQDKELAPEAGKRKPIRHHKPQVADLAGHLLTIFGGRDATKLSGFSDYTWLELYGELGADLSQWPSEKHCTPGPGKVPDSWLGLAPGQNDSGKKKKKSKSKGKPKVGQIFKQMAQSLLTSKRIGLGAFGRRLKSRKGPGVAIKAMARNLAIQYWRLMVKGVDFVEKGVEHYHQRLLEQKQKQLNRLALEFNVALFNVALTPI